MSEIYEELRERLDMFPQGFPRTESRVELEILRELVAVDEGGDGLAARGGAALGPEEMKKFGLSGREIRELIDKLDTGKGADFELDIGQMLPAAEFESRMREAVPGDYD